MKHYILGAGNLGKDLQIELRSKGFEAELWSRSKGKDYSRKDEFAMPSDAEAIWYCIGGGSVEDAKRDPPKTKFLNLTFPVEIARQLKLRKTRLVVFSTDYVADEESPSDFTAECTKPRSDYARQKLAMEHAFLKQNRGNTAIVRVGSLYGVHKPERTFPGKILQNYGYGDLKARIRLPNNLVTPTPTRWLAGMLVKNFEKLFHDAVTNFHHCAPYGNVSVHDWAKYVLEGLREPGEFFDTGAPYFDEERPYVSNLKCSFAEDKYHWFDLWKTYFKQEWFIPRSDSVSCSL